MSFVGPGDVVTYLYWMEQVQKLGLGDTTTPGAKERRMHEENGEFNLKVYDGGWVKCNRDADLLNGRSESFYRNASNLNSGTVPQARLSASAILTLITTVDGAGSGLDTDLYRSKIILAGTVSAKNTGTVLTFPEAFTGTPNIVCVCHDDFNAWVRSISTTSCILFSSSTINKQVDWIAIGPG